MRRIVGPLLLLAALLLANEPARATEPAPPSSPTDVSVLQACFGPTSSCSLWVRWQAPADDGGASITSYTVTGRPSGLSTTVAGDVDAVHWTGDDPELGDSSFTVTATNAVGTSAPATAPTLYAPSPGGPPQSTDGPAAVRLRVVAHDNGPRDDRLHVRLTGGSDGPVKATVNGRRHALDLEHGSAVIKVKDRNRAMATTYVVRLDHLTSRCTVR